MSAASSSRPLTASTDEKNAGYKARVERRKVSEGAYERGPVGVREECGSVVGWVLVGAMQLPSLRDGFYGAILSYLARFRSLLRDTGNRATKKGFGK